MEITNTNTQEEKEEIKYHLTYVYNYVIHKKQLLIVCGRLCHRTNSITIRLGYALQHEDDEPDVEVGKRLAFKCTNYYNSTCIQDWGVPLFKHDDLEVYLAKYCDYLLSHLEHISSFFYSPRYIETALRNTLPIYCCEASKILRETLDMSIFSPSMFKRLVKTLLDAKVYENEGIHEYDCKELLENLMENLKDVKD